MPNSRANLHFLYILFIGHYVSPPLSVGIETQRDSVTINFDKKELEKIVIDFKSLNIEEIRAKYKIEKDGRDWQIETAKNDVILKGDFCKIFYRPFDFRYTYYSGKSKGFMAYPRNEVMNNLVDKDNVSLIVCKQQSTFDFQHVFLSRFISDGNSISMQTKERANVFPLYLYPETSTQQTLETQPEKIPNFNEAIIKAIEKSINHIMIPEGIVVDLAAGCDGTFTPVDVLDYIYAVLHSPTYREKYKEFLKIDFPRVPYPTNKETFWQLVKLGSQLRKIHLLEAPVVNKPITKYPVDGDNVVVKTSFVIPTQQESAQQSTNAQSNAVIPTQEESAHKKTNAQPNAVIPRNEESADAITNAQPVAVIPTQQESAHKKTNAQPTGNVFINDTQYFANVPQTAWQFFIGGYQPAQKWLKDRKGRKLEFEDILHYQKIIVALTETARLMEEIDKVEI